MKTDLKKAIELLLYYCKQIEADNGDTWPDLGFYIEKVENEIEKERNYESTK